jgi:hypothetical protein
MIHSDERLRNTNWEIRTTFLRECLLVAHNNGLDGNTLELCHEMHNVWRRREVTISLDFWGTFLLDQPLINKNAGGVWILIWINLREVLGDEEYIITNEGAHTRVHEDSLRHRNVWPKRQAEAFEHTGAFRIEKTLPIRQLDLTM